MTDLRYALRTLLKNRAFATTAIITLALGIGASTAIFTVVHGVLLRPLPYADSDQLTMVWLANPVQGIDKDVSPYPTFRAFRSQARSFSHLTAYTRQSMNLTEAGEPQRVRGAVVTAGFFSMLGAHPLIGRAFRDDEHEAGRHEVALIGHGLWARAFGNDRSIVGRTISLNNARYTIIGVMPAGFAFPADAEFWLPMAPVGGLRNAFEARGSYWLSVVGRLRGGELSLARAELERVLRQLEKEFGSTYEGQGVVLESLQDSMVGHLRTPLVVLQGAVLFLLLIACANVANLLFARATARARELAIRTALGAGRGRIVRQLLTESLVLAAAGSSAGVVLAVWGIDLLQAFGPDNLPRLADIRVNGTVLAFAAAIGVAASVVFGLVPALQVAVPEVNASLKGGGRDGGEQGGSARARAMLVVAQISLALMLLVGAGLLFKSFSRILAVDPGFNPDRVLPVEVALTTQKYPQSEHRSAFYARLLERIQRLPGVESAGGIRDILLSRLPNSAPIAIEGRGDLSDADRNLPIAFDPVTPGFFRALQIPIVRGRELTEADTATAPRVAIVNEALVRRFFPGRDPLGHRITFDDPTRPNVRWTTIVGVARDARRSGLDLPPRPELYLPHAQYSTADLTLAIRAAGDSMSLLSAVRAAVAEIDPQLPLARVATLDSLVGASLAERRFNMLLLVVFSVLAVTLAAVGIYGVVAYTVSRRTREFGVRLALGAQRRHLLGMVLGHGARVTIADAALGVAGALALTRVLASLLYEISPTDAVTFVAVTALLVAIALLACYLPARRAMRIDPVIALRAE